MAGQATEWGELASTSAIGWWLAKTVLVLGAVCLLVYLTLRLLQRRLGGASGARRLEVVERLPLDARRSVYVVRAGSKVLLVGSGERDVQLLAELDPDEWPRQAPGRAPVVVPPAAEPTHES